MPQQAWGVETTTFTGAIDSAWGTDGNWNNGVPQNGDTAIIDTGKTADLAGASTLLERLEVKSTANLNVKAGGTVTLDPVTTPTPSSTVSGTITLESSTSKIEVKQTLTLDGAGKIVGSDNSAEINLANQKVLTNTTTIEGKLKITGGSGTKFVNQGKVHADVAGTLWVNTADVDDSAAGLWWVSTSSSAILRFDPTISGGVPPRSLEGDFTVEAGTLNSNFPGFSSTGTLIWTAGTIDCASNGGAQARCTGS
jgi:hypothetical protein